MKFCPHQWFYLHDKYHLLYILWNSEIYICWEWDLIVDIIIIFLFNLNHFKEEYTHNHEITEFVSLL